MRQLSDGQKARIVFAKLAMDKPHLLMLDEPTNHLVRTRRLFRTSSCVDGVVMIPGESTRLVSARRRFRDCICATQARSARRCGLLVVAGLFIYHVWNWRRCPRGTGCVRRADSASSLNLNFLRSRSREPWSPPRRRRDAFVASRDRIRHTQVPGGGRGAGTGGAATTRAGRRAFDGRGRLPEITTKTVAGR